MNPQQLDPDALVVRPAERADLPALGRLGALLVAAHHDFDPRRFIAGPANRPEDLEQAYAAFLATELERPNVVVLVAERGGAVVGYAFAATEGYDYLTLRGPAGLLHDLIVDAGHRGGGVGQALLDATLAALAARGATQIVLGTAERNVSAQRFFARAGFRRTMIEMTKELG
jgi:ribosomal protein S18 acetylase RimI-like enzyme